MTTVKLLIVASMLSLLSAIPVRAEILSISMICVTRESIEDLNAYQIIADSNNIVVIGENMRTITIKNKFGEMSASNIAGRGDVINFAVSPKPGAIQKWMINTNPSNSSMPFILNAMGTDERYYTLFGTCEFM
jgi:hypothetical protein